MKLEEGLENRKLYINLEKARIAGVGCKCDQGPAAGPGASEPGLAITDEMWAVDGISGPVVCWICFLCRPSVHK